MCQPKFNSFLIEMLKRNCQNMQSVDNLGILSVKLVDKDFS